MISSSCKHKVIGSKLGFTLVEILVAISILATLAGGTYIALNPATQLNKSRDAVSIQGLQELRTALDTYYADTNCFPRLESVFTSALNSGGEWKNDLTDSVYIQNVPFDGYGDPFIYLTEPQDNTCPQWYSLFARLRTTPDKDVCQLDNNADEACVPAGFDEKWACVTAGITNCALLAEGQVTGNSISLPTPTPLPPGAPTPTPTDFAEFTISMNTSMFPRFYNGSISSKNPTPGQEVTLKVDSFNTSNFQNPYDVVSATATIRTDNRTTSYPLALTSGTAKLGGWSRTWTQNDTVNHTFIITINATDSGGNQSKVDVVIR